jgi:hypothetical protein
MNTCAECRRLREGLQLIATDEHRLMNVTARNIAQSILDGKPSGVSPPADPYANAPLTGPGSRLHADLNPFAAAQAQILESGGGKANLTVLFGSLNGMHHASKFVEDAMRSAPTTVQCNCAGIAPTMPTYRTEHLPTCPCSRLPPKVECDCKDFCNGPDTTDRQCRAENGTF